MKLRHIEFLALPDRRVLAILVINEKEVQNRVLHMEREYSATELQHAASLGARSRSVGFNDFMVYKVGRAATIANAGRITSPDDVATVHYVSDRSGRG